MGYEAQWRLLAGLAGLAVVAGGCYAGIGPNASGGGGTDTAGDASASGGSESDTDSGSDTEGPADTDGGGEFEAGATPMRRLTRAQFVQSTRDLLEIPDWSPSSELPDEGLNEEEFQLPNMVAATVTTTTLGYSRYREAAKDAAEVAFATDADLSQRLGCMPNAPDDSCVRDYLAALAEQAWSRRVDTDDPTLAELLDIVADATDKLQSVRLGVQWAVNSIVQSPEFIYVYPAAGNDGKMDDYSVARALALTFRDSVPDAELLDLARSGELGSKAALAGQVDRLIEEMIENPSRRGAVHRFFDEWWSMNVVSSMQKDATAYPEFTDSLRDSMKAEVEHWLSDLLFERQADFRQVLLSKRTFVNDELAALYGLEGAFGDELTEVSLPDGTPRAGLLTNPAFLSVMAHPSITSPAARGKFISERLLCLTIPPPPGNVDTTIPEPEGPETKRERFGRHTTDAVCAGCHRLMDPMGLSLETFDAIGRYREVDTVVFEDETYELPLDTTGELGGVPFANAAQMAKVVSDDPNFSACVARQLMRQALGREIDNGEMPVLDELSAGFVEQDFDFLDLMRSTATHSLFTTVKEQE